MNDDVMKQFDEQNIMTQNPTNYNFILKCPYNNSYQSDAIEVLFDTIKSLFDGYNNFAERKFESKEAFYPKVNFEFENEGKSIKVKFNIGYDGNRAKNFADLQYSFEQKIKEEREELEQKIKEEREELDKEWKMLESVKQICELPKNYDGKSYEEIERECDIEVHKEFLDEEKFNKWFAEKYGRN